MSNAEAKKIAKSFGKSLKKNGYIFSALYLFGSHAKGKATKWSDIDIAVVSHTLDKNYEKGIRELWKERLQIDTRIEPHGFSPKDFKNNADPLAYEIRKTGIRIM